MTSTPFLSRLRFNRPLYNFSSAKKTQTLRLPTIPTRRTLFLAHMLFSSPKRGYNNLNVNVNVTSGSAFDKSHSSPHLRAKLHDLVSSDCYTPHAGFVILLIHSIQLFTHFCLITTIEAWVYFHCRTFHDGVHFRAIELFSNL